MTGPFCVEARGLRKVFRVRRSHRVVTALNGIDLGRSLRVRWLRWWGRTERQDHIHAHGLRFPRA